MAFQYLAKDLQLFIDGAGRSASAFSFGLKGRDDIGLNVTEQARLERWDQMAPDCDVVNRVCPFGGAVSLPLTIAMQLVQTWAARFAV
jgi:hypothetical protein